MQVAVTYRKGEGNKRFQGIVRNVVEALSIMEPSSLDFDSLLLTELWKLDQGYSQRREFPIFKKHGYQIDIYHTKKKIAIEIEKSEAKLVWKNLCKFSVGARRGMILYAILITPKHYYGKAMKTPTRPYYAAINASEFMGEILWVRNLAILGY